MKMKIKYQLLLVVAFALIVQNTLTSCSKSLDNGDLEGGKVVLKLNYKGAVYPLQENADIPDNLIQNRGESTKMANQIKSAPLPNGDVLVAVLEEANHEESRSARTSRAIEMAPDVKYRILVYDANEKLVTQEQFISVDKDASLIMDAGKSYTFVIYSFNNTKDIPPISKDVALSDLVLQNITADSEFLYNKSVKKIEYGSSNFLDVVLHYQMAKVSVVFESSPDMGVFTSVKASLGMHYPSANFNLGRKELMPYGTPVMLPLIITGQGNLWESKELIICGTTNKGSSLKISEITLNEMTQSLPNSGDGQIPNTGIPELTGFQIKPGYHYKLKVSFQAAGIRVNNLVWAKGNLAKVNGIYFNRHLPEETGWAQGLSYGSETTLNNKRYHTDYWTFDSFEPLKVISASWPNNKHIDRIKDVVDDPCTKIIGGRWRMPTVQEFADLGDVNSTFTEPDVQMLAKFQPNGNPNVGHIWWDGVNEITGKPERLRFYAAGRAYGAGVNPWGTWRPGYFQYLAIDANIGCLSCLQGAAAPTVYEQDYINSLNGGCSYRLDPPTYRGSVSGKTFVSDRHFDGTNEFSRDERLPIRCVRDVLN
ncbi:hypothetical protein GCM10022216_18260 [Sphingobacterium kyonggiense]|uniref:Fimbrillin-like protein n=1 Tax=Sphingobacterium kyonggiense TaxID=714075 RepID=A0ABP7YQK8_9SPHI